jgi:hypothetical protein
MGFRIALLLLTSLVVACAKDSQNPEAGASVSLALGESDCIKGTDDKIQRFFAGTGTESEIDGVFTCMTKILHDFGTYTRGASPAGYSGAELQGFLSKYYFKGGLSDDVIKSTLALKRVIAGGEGNFLTHAELQELTRILGVLNSATHNLYPITKILFTKAYLTAPEADWFHAHDVLSAEAGKLALIFSGHGKDYQFADLQDLLQSWADQLKLPPEHLVAKAKNLVPVLASGKALLIAGARDGMRPDEWQPLLATLSKGYSYWRMLARSNSGADALAILGSTRLPSVVDGVTNLLDQAVQRRSDKQIPITDVRDFLAGLKTLDYLPDAMTADQATSAVQFLPAKLFAGGTPSSGAVTAKTVSEMRRFLGLWNGNDAALAAQDFSGAAEFGAATRPGGAALAFDGQGRSILPSAGGGVFHEFALLYTVLEWVGNQWGTWPLTQAEFNPVVSDCITVLHNLNLLTTFDATVANRLMREANLFVPSANGDLILDKAEAFQYGVYALSGYRGSHALELATESCASDTACISSAMFAKRDQLLSNFPSLLLWLNNDPAKWSTFSANLAKIVGADKWLMQFVVMHYIETYMMRFDANHDQQIDFNESMVGFPVYQPILGVLLPQNGLGAGDIKPMYTFLFRYGMIPTAMPNGKSTYVIWKLLPSTWVYFSDRNILAGILASLGDMTK